jgi:hypothetical protein
VKRTAATLERRVVAPIRSVTVHPNHRSLHQTMACGECMRRFWDAQGRLEELGPSARSAVPVFGSL